MACLELKPSVYYLKDFCEDHAGFKVDMMTKGKKSHVLPRWCSLADAEITTADHVAGGSVVEGSNRVLVEAQDLQRTAMIEKAREALNKKKDERITKRTFKLNGV